MNKYIQFKMTMIITYKNILSFVRTCFFLYCFQYVQMIYKYTIFSKKKTNSFPIYILHYLQIIYKYSVFSKNNCFSHQCSSIYKDNIQIFYLFFKKVFFPIYVLISYFLIAHNLIHRYIQSNIFSKINKSDIYTFCIL